MSSSPIDHEQASRRQWWIVFAAGAVALIAGAVGVLNYDHDHPTDNNALYTFSGAVYASLQMLVLHTPHFEGKTNFLLEFGRWLGAGVLVSAATLLLLGRFREELRLLRLSRWKGHHVVLGLGDRGMAFIDSIKGGASPVNVVVVDPHPDAGYVKRCHRLSVPVIRMTAIDPHALRAARVATASEIICVAGDDETNIRIAAEVRQVVRPAGVGAAVCRVQVSTSHLSGALQSWTDTAAGSEAKLRFFDAYDNEARRVLLGAPTTGTTGRGPTPIDGSGIGHEKDAAVKTTVHVVVCGMGRMGTALVLRAAKVGQFANGQRVRISVIDLEADGYRDRLLFRHPILSDPNNGVCDLQFHQQPADSPKTRGQLTAWVAEPNTLLHVFVCLDSDARTAEVALRMWEMVRANPRAHVNIRIKTRSSVGKIIDSVDPRVCTFGGVEDTCTVDSIRNEYNEALAISIHEAFAVEQRKKPARRGDAALELWKDLRDDFRESNRQQADHIPIKMRAIGRKVTVASEPGVPVTQFDETKEIEMLAELEHRRWNAERWLGGWVHGPVTKKPERIHENLVGWNQLTDEIQNFDREAVRQIPNLLAATTPPMKVIPQTPPPASL